MKHRLLWISLICLGLALFLAGRVWLWRANVLLTAEAPFTAVFRAENEITGTSFSCAERTCNFELSPGEYRLEVTAEGYFPFQETVELSWRGENELDIELQKIPVLRSLQEKPLSWANADQAAENLQAQFVLENSGKLFRIAPEGNMLLAEFPAQEAPELQIVPENSERIFLFAADRIYKVDATERRKFLVFTLPQGEVLTGIKPLPNGTLLAQSENSAAKKTFLFFLADRHTVELPEPLTENFTCQHPEKAEELFFLAEEGQWLLKKLNLATSEITGLAGYDFETTPQRIFCEGENTIFIETAEKYYELRF